MSGTSGAFLRTGTTAGTYLVSGLPVDCPAQNQKWFIFEDIITPVMDYELLLRHIHQHISLDPDEEAYFLDLLHPRTLKPRQFLYHEGDVHKGQAFVTSGCLRSYAIDH